MTLRAFASTLAASARWVDRFWTKRGVVAAAERVLPDGCVDVIVQLGTRPHAFVVGTMTRTFIVPPGPVDAVAVRLKPGVARALFGVPVCELVDRRVALGELVRGSDVLVEGLVDAPHERARLQVLERWLAAVGAQAAGPDAVVARAIDRIQAAPGARVADLVRELGCSRQHLARAFRREVGVGPKELARIVRLDRLVDRLRPGVAPRWAQLAVECGYYDQAHLVNEFATLVGTTPARFASGSIPPIPTSVGGASSRAQRT